MSSQAFFWMNIGCALILVLLFLIGRKGITAPSRLNLRKGAKYSKSEASPKSVPVTKKNSPDVHFHTKSDGSPREKNLNVMFIYNGHNFEAYEVLGAPAGASYEMALKYFNQSLARSGSDREFLETALEVIKQNQQK